MLKKFLVPIYGSTKSVTHNDSLTNVSSFLLFLLSSVLQEESVDSTLSNKSHQHVKVYTVGVGVYSHKEKRSRDGNTDENPLRWWGKEDVNGQWNKGRKGEKN